MSMAPATSPSQADRIHAHPTSFADSAGNQWTTLRNVNPAASCDYRRLPAGIGPIPCAIGTKFPSRDAASIVHNMTQAGIAGTEFTGCSAICINGGYADDVDNGFRVIYTGSSGADVGQRISSSAQANLNTDQRWTDGNKALRTSMAKEWPVRVLRGPKSAEWADEREYRYDGLYMVLKCWIERGRTGVKIIRFALERLHDQGPLFVNDRTIPAPDYDRDEAYDRDWPRLNDDDEVQRPVRKMEPFAACDPKFVYIKPKAVEIEPSTRFTEAQLAARKAARAKKVQQKALLQDHAGGNTTPPKRRRREGDGDTVVGRSRSRSPSADRRQARHQDASFRGARQRSTTPPLPKRKNRPVPVPW